MFIIFNSYNFFFKSSFYVWKCNNKRPPLTQDQLSALSEQEQEDLYFEFTTYKELSFSLLSSLPPTLLPHSNQPLESEEKQLKDVKIGTVMAQMKGHDFAIQLSPSVLKKYQQWEIMGFSFKPEVSLSNFIYSSPSLSSLPLSLISSLYTFSRLSLPLHPRLFVFLFFLFSHHFLQDFDYNNGVMMLTLLMLLSKQIIVHCTSHIGGHPFVSKKNFKLDIYFTLPSHSIQSFLPSHNILDQTSNNNRNIVCFSMKEDAFLGQY